jgi:glyoxylase-like metal-dependent hydrolase (beta-lactamase superfamily II)
MKSAVGVCLATWLSRVRSVLSPPACLHGQPGVQRQRCRGDYASGLIPVDALGTPALAEELPKEKRQRTSLPITHVIVTHDHADHFYGLQVFNRLGARIVAARPAPAAIGSSGMQERFAERRMGLPLWGDKTFEVASPDLLIDAPTSTEFGGAWFWLIPAGPAYTPDDLMM